MDQYQSIRRGATSNILQIQVGNSSVTTGAGLTGLVFNSAGLIISTICDNEAAATTYTVAGSTIETIATLGTYAAPTATKCRFKEVDGTNHPGLYELMLADARFNVTASRRMTVSMSGATNMRQTNVNIDLTSIDNNVYAGGLDELNITTIATLASQTSFTLTGGSANDNAYNGCSIIFRNATTATQKCVGVIQDYVGSTKTVTLFADPGVFTIAAGDYVTIMEPVAPFGASVAVRGSTFNGVLTFSQP